MRFESGRSIAVLVLAVTLACAGCASLRSGHAHPANLRASARATAADPVLSLLDYAHELADDSPSERERAVKHERHVVHHDPGAVNYARLALALGTPGQRLYTPDEAARYARRALDTGTDHWSPAARQYLSDYSRLYTALTQSGAAAAAAAAAAPASDASPGTASPGGGAAAQQRIAELQSQLDEAHRKLRALVDIENHLETRSP